MAIQQIDQQPNQIRNERRQKSLESPPSNFQKLMHGYAADILEFINWKDQLEEHLFWCYPLLQTN